MVLSGMAQGIAILGGTGWLGLALGRNLLARGLPPEALRVLNRRGPTADYEGFPGVHWATDLADLIAGAGVLVLSVRPEDYHVSAPQGFDGLVISFMAGVPLARLAQDWPQAIIARAMPGGGAQEGQAHVPWCAGEIPAAAVTRVAGVLGAIGMVDRVADEAALAYMSALSGSGAAYPALMAQAMYQDALKRGIAPDVAWRAVRSVVCAAPALFTQGPEQAAALLDSYHGYRGVTAAGLSAAEAAGFAEAITAALEAATQKALNF